MSKIDEPKAMERAPIAEARMIFEAVASKNDSRPWPQRSRCAVYSFYIIYARAGSVQFAGTMVQTMVVWPMPMLIKSPLKETVEAGVPAQVFDELLPLQPVPEAEQ